MLENIKNGTKQKGKTETEEQELINSETLFLIAALLGARIQSPEKDPLTGKVKYVKMRDRDRYEKMYVKYLEYISNDCAMFMSNSNFDYFINKCDLITANPPYLGITIIIIVIIITII